MRMAKRLIDLFISLYALMCLVYIFLGLAILVRLILGSPILFVQARPGLHGKLFRLIKFRTMTCDRDDSGNLLPDSERLSTFGRFMRACSLDELPELWNVLMGDMSLVGPRPLLSEYLPLYNSHQSRRHKVKPGLTGLAQVSGRNELSWKERFELDVWYVDNQSLVLDLKILWMTLLRVLKREGITQKGSATMERFCGN